MPFIGARCKADDILVIVRANGPNKTFKLTGDELSEKLGIIARNLLNEGDNQFIYNWPTIIAKQTADFVKDRDDNILWIDCEVLHTNGISYGVVVEI